VLNHYITILDSLKSLDYDKLLLTEQNSPDRALRKVWQDAAMIECHLLGALHVSPHSSAMRFALERVLAVSVDELLDISQHTWY